MSKGLQEDLVRRGLPTDGKYLFVLDASQALHHSVESVFGDQAEVQRCQRHEERNVLSSLPRSDHAPVRQGLPAAWGLD